MTTRQGDAEALVRRCEEAQFPVTRGRNGYKIQTPVGMYPIHRTYSDIRSLTNATKALERMGLTEAERRMASIREQARITRAEKIKRDERAAAQKATQDALTIKAAGPYMVEAEDVPLEWFATPHPAMWPRLVNVTPELASALLENFNVDNRTLRPAAVLHYRNIIVSKQWHTTHQGAAMDTRPMLQDGQHRLAAVVDASEHLDDLKVPFLFFVGMPVENFKAIDEGLLRSAADLFSRGDNRESYASTLGTIIRLSAAFQDPNARRFARQKTTNEAIFTYWETDPEQIRAAAKWSVANYKKVFATAGPLGAAHYLIRKANGFDNKFVTAFFEGLSTGRRAGSRITLDEVDPRYVLREHFQNIKMRQKRIQGIEQVALIVMAWNNIVTNRTPRTARFTDDMAMPRIIVCQDTGPNASAVPQLLHGEVDEYDDEV